MWGDGKRYRTVRDEWWFRLRHGTEAHVCDDVPERPSGDHRIESVMWDMPVMRTAYRLHASPVIRIKLEGDDRWWTPDQLHVRER